MRISRGDGARRRRVRRAARSRRLPGHIAIGHTRYSTAGESRLQNAQPILIDCAHGQIAIAHNGNLVNARELRDAAGPRRFDLPDQQRHRGGAAPLRALARAHGRRRAGRVDLAGQRRVLAGAADEGSADRRARSARLPPARARPARRRLHRLLRDLRARSDRRHLHPRRRARRAADHQRRRAAIARPFPPAPLAHCVFEHVYFARPDSYVFGRSVNEVRTELGRILARESRVDADVVIPIPDSGVCAAIGFAEASASRCAWG